jgi:hypothetical protein
VGLLYLWAIQLNAPQGDEAHFISLSNGLTDTDLFSTVRDVALNREIDGTGTG